MVSLRSEVVLGQDDIVLDGDFPKKVEGHITCLMWPNG